MHVGESLLSGVKEAALALIWNIAKLSISRFEMIAWKCAPNGL